MPVNPTTLAPRHIATNIPGMSISIVDDCVALTMSGGVSSSVFSAGHCSDGNCTAVGVAPTSVTWTPAKGGWVLQFPSGSWDAYRIPSVIRDASLPLLMASAALLGGGAGGGAPSGFDYAATSALVVKMSEMRDFSYLLLSLAPCPMR